MPQESKRRKTGLDGREKDEAAALESLLFNQSDAHVAQLGRESEYQLGDAHAFGAEPSQRGDASGLLAVFEERQPQVQPDGKPQAAWADSDDENVQVAVVQRARLRKLRETEDEETLTGKEYEKRLRQQHKKLNPRASWATVQPESAAQETALDGLLTQAGGLLTGSRHLPPGQLEATRLKDANHEDPSKSVVNSIEFHPNGQLVMAAGLDRRLRFFNVDGVDNPRVQSIFLEDMPVHKAAFSGGGAQVIVTGRRSFFYVLDLETANIERVVGIFGRDERSFESFAASPAAPVVAFFGRDGNVPLVSTTSRQSVGCLKMNGTIRAGAFSSDGKELLTSGGDGIIYLWDLRMQRCLRRYVDEGSTGGTSLAASPDGRTFASGTKSGIVNVYHHPSQAAPTGGNGVAGAAASVPEAPLMLRPLRALSQLTTSADTLAFNGDGQMLAIASRLKRDALRLVHLPSLTVFSNWPTSRTPLHYVHSVCFSPGSGYLAVGNAKGRVVLYRLHHFPQA